VGYKQALTQVKRLQADYRFVFINNTYEPALIRYLFYTDFPPARFHHQFTLDQAQPDIAPGYDGFALGQTVFFGTFSTIAREADWSQRLLPGALYVISQRDEVGGDWDWRANPPAGVKVLFTSTDPTGLPLFYLVTPYELPLAQI